MTTTSQAKNCINLTEAIFQGDLGGMDGMEAIFQGDHRCCGDDDGGEQGGYIPS